MFEIFKEKIEEIYSIIMQPLHTAYKLTAIHNCKKELNMDYGMTFGEFYYNIMSNNKERGAVYTPPALSQYMIENTILTEEIIRNPYLKIIDPACGVGNILIPIYRHLKDIYTTHYIEINKIHGLNLNEGNIEAHIVTYNIFGFDVDFLAIQILKIDLFALSLNVVEKNIILQDFLLEECEEKYDIIIGNPPYISMKTIDKEYASLLKIYYREVYKDKGDILYCFFHKAVTYLKKSGKLTFISSRYFIESPSGEELRKVLKEVCSLYKIVDFYGIRPFKNTGIDPVIIFLINEQNEEGMIEIIKPSLNKGRSNKSFLEDLVNKNRNNINQFIIHKSVLNNKGWILRDEKERNIINKIEKKSFTHLFNISESYQGIITGCDRAFVLEQEEIKKHQIEELLIKPWIKSSNIDKNVVSHGGKYILYADLIEREEQFPKAIEFIRGCEEQLKNRRECRNGIRPWYKLQWGRVQNIFEGEKIIFPFKASSNRFALDCGSYFSADVYALRLKENVPFSYEYLLFLLNSNLYEYYFKTFAKKLGENQYEYYPNNLMKLCIPTMWEEENFNENYLYEYFELTEEEMEIVKNYI